MSKLTDTQLIVLSKAAARDDGCAEVQAKMPKAAAAKVGSSLIARKLMREIKAKPDMPVWREDADNRTYSLVLTSAGRKAIGVEDDGEAKPAVAAKRAKATSSPAESAPEKQKAGRAATEADVSSPPRAGSKQALVIDMLSAKAGTTIDAIVDATGWLPHTTRAALTGLRKKGFAIARDRQPGTVSVYRITEAAPAVEA